jgi:hypothetical protein
MLILFRTALGFKLRLFALAGSAPVRPRLKAAGEGDVEWQEHGERRETLRPVGRKWGVLGTGMGWVGYLPGDHERSGCLPTRLYPASTHPLSLSLS